MFTVGLIRTSRSRISRLAALRITRNSIDEAWHCATQTDSGEEPEKQDLLQCSCDCRAKCEHAKRGGSADQHIPTPVAISDRSKPKGTEHEAKQSGTEKEADLVWRNMERF